MKPIIFKEANITIGKDQPQYLQLPAAYLLDDERKPMVTCWKLSLWERLRVLWCGRIWNAQLTFDYPYHPVIISTYKSDAIPSKGLDNRIIFFEKRRINRDDKDQYMTRLTLFECGWISLKLHKFYASDDQCLHDHPWSFISFILWRGYNEITPLFQDWYNSDLLNDRNPVTVKKSVWPGSIIFRPALWVHRVELRRGKDGKEKPAYTFVISFRRIRKWGFFTKSGWIHWKKYSAKEHC
jgi:hypothetical protein